MSKLERWLPFKFLRKNAETKKTEAARQDSSQALAPRQDPWAPFAPFFSPAMNQMLERVFSDPFFRDPFSRFSDLDRWFGDFSPARFQPSTDVVDEEDAIRVTAELPGMDKDDITVNIDNDMLIIRGEKRNEDASKEKGVYRSERYYGYFERAIPLPADLDRDKVEAKFKNGVLTVRLPKLPEARSTTKQIPVSG